MKLFISPRFHGMDKGHHGGIRRIVDNQLNYFSSSLVKTPEEADVIAVHAGSGVKVRPDQVLIAHCHGLYWDKYDWGSEGDYVNQQVMNVMRVADAITAPTEWVANSLRRSLYSKVSVIGHGVDPEWQPSKINQGYVLWNKSRIDKVCDPTPAFKLATLLPDVDFRITVAPQDAIIPANVTITGLTPYVDKTSVQHAGVYLATAQETFGIGILEALACGVPVVGWNWGGQAEIVDHKVTGFLAQEGDYYKLAEGIIWCLEYRQDMVADCVKVASGYTWDKVLKQYEELYETELDEKNSRKRISVIIRNYNTGKYLEDAINSVVGQLDTVSDELIVVDDCSNDNSKQMFDIAVEPIYEVEGKNTVRWVQTPKNLHLSGAYNYGIEHSNGEYIVLLDADNMLTDRAIKTMLDELEKDRNLDIAYGRVKFVKEDGTTPDSSVTGTKDGVSAWPPAKFRLDQQLAHKNQVPCTTMYRRRVYERVGPYRSRCRVAEDADFWCRAGVLGFQFKLVTNAPTLIYRNRPGTTSQTERDWPWEAVYKTWKSLDAASCEPVLVSVIIPVGPGHELYLQDALDSLYMQTFKNWECIVINDTGTKLPWLPDWVRLYDALPIGRHGPAICRNLGLNMAKGMLWMPLDADDFLSPNALEQMLRHYIQNKGYVYSDHYRVEDGAVIKTPSTSCSVILENMPHVITGLYPVNEIRFDPEIELFEDWDYVIQMTQAGYCGSSVGMPLVHYRKQSGTRRIQDNEKFRQALKNKWSKVDMACSGCGKKNGVSIQQQAVRMASIPTGNMTQLLYIGKEDKKYYTGQVSGQKYAFGIVPGHQIKWVLNEDVQGFIDRGMWKVYNGEFGDVEISPSLVI